MPSTGVPSLLFHVTISVSPSARSRTCGLMSVSLRGDANVGSLTKTSAGAFGVSIAKAIVRPSVDVEMPRRSSLSTTRVSLRARDVVGIHRVVRALACR